MQAWKWMLVGMWLSLPGLALAQLKTGELPPKVTLEGETGAVVDGKPWNSESLKGKVHGVWYIDPDERTINDHVSAALKKENFPKEKYASVSILNMDATWLPNSVLSSALADKQKEFPETVFVKDLKKVLVEKWGLKDDGYEIMVFDQEGKLAFRKNGKFSDEDTQALIKAIRERL